MTTKGLLDAAEALVDRTAVARGLPRIVTDPVLLARLAALVRPPDPVPHRARSRKAPEAA